MSHEAIDCSRMVLSQLYIDHRDETRNDEIHFIKLERSGEQHG